VLYFSMRAIVLGSFVAIKRIVVKRYVCIDLVPCILKAVTLIKVSMSNLIAVVCSIPKNRLNTIET
jgi:hypothetical protein